MTASLLLTLINVAVLGVNVGVLWITVKLYSEVLKVRHIQNIGKV